MATALLIIGFLISLGAGIWLLVLAFQENIWWGIGSLLIGPVMLVFAFMHWDRAKVPFLINLAGVALIVAGIFLQAPTGSLPAS